MARFGDIIDYEDKIKTGYKFEKTIPGIGNLTISANSVKNIMKVYYIVDESKTKELSYTIEYYKNNIIQSNDTIIDKKVVQILEGTQIKVNTNNINITNKYIGYDFVKMNPTAIPSSVENGTVIKIYYQERESSVSNSGIEKIGTQVIKTSKDRVNYKLTYKTQIDNYIGTGKVKIVDTLPYPIDEAQSILKGGIYSAGDNTITWEEDLGAINTYNEAGYNRTHKVEIIKDITLKFENIDLEKESFVNRVKGYVYFPNKNIKKENDAEHTTNINVNGNLHVRYIDKNTGEEITDSVTKIGKVGTEFDVSEDKKEIEKYVLIEEPAEKTGKYTEKDQERIYYYAKKSGTGTGEELGVGVHVTYIDKATGKEIADDEKIEGYVGKLYETEKKIIDKYRFVESTNNTSGQMKESTIEVIYYYESNVYGYKVQYYYDGKIDANNTEINTGIYGDVITKYEDKNKDGYRFEKTQNLPLTISDKEDTNIIKVYYIKDNEDKKTLNYKVEYYKDGEKQEQDTQTEYLTVNSNDSDKITVNKSNINTSNKYTGYEFQRTEPNTIPDTVNNGDVIKVYYVKVDPNITENKITKTGTQQITSTDEKVLYNIVYETVIDNYKGKATVDIEDILPYRINEEKSDLDGGKYDRVNKKITWTVDLGQIDTYATGKNVSKHIKVEKKIGLVYQDIDKQQDGVANKVKSTLHLSDSDLPDQETKDEDEHKTNIDLKGKVEVKYIDINTDREIKTSVIKNGKVGEEFDITEDRREIPGYVLIEEPSQKVGTYEEGTQEKIYYYAKETMVHVTYKDIDTKLEIEQDEIIEGYEGQSYRTTQKTISHYTYIQNTNNTYGKMSDKTIEVIYYYKAIKYSYTVEYYYDGIKDTTKTVRDEALYGERIRDYANKVISGYKLEKISNLPLTITEDTSRNVIKIYYIKNDGTTKTLSYTVEYYKDEELQEEDTYTEIQTVNIDANDMLTVNKSNINKNDMYPGYEFIKTNPRTIPTQIENGGVIKVYYGKVDSSIPKNEVTKTGTEQIIKANDKVSYKITYEAKIDNYKGKVGVHIVDTLPYQIDTSNSSLDGGTYSRAENTITWDVDIGDINTYETGKNVTKTVKVVKNITVQYKNIDLSKDYMLNRVHSAIYLPADNKIEEDDDEKETEIDVDGTVVVKYVDKNTGEEILDRVIKDGKVGTDYDITDTKREINGYTIMEEPQIKTGIYKDKAEEKIYYYAKNTKVHVTYIDKNTGDKISEDETINGYEGKEYDTQKRNIEGYTYVESTKNTSGKMKDSIIEVIYYYKYNTKVIVQYIDKDTGSILGTVEETGLVGDRYESIEKSFTGYVLDEEPDNKTVTMKKEVTILRYYYKKVKPDEPSNPSNPDDPNNPGNPDDPNNPGNPDDKVKTAVIEKHIDDYTGEVLEEKLHRGYVGDIYSTSALKFARYDLVKEKMPSNAVGKMTSDIIEVDYYYKKRASVTVEYIDKNTEEKIQKDIVIEGHEGDEYTTEEKELDGYKIVKVPDNKNGKMTDDDITVKYYYVKVSAGVLEKHIDDSTGEVLFEKTHEGYEGDEYKIEEKTFVGYEVVKSKYPNNAQGKMKKDLTEVTYYYKKKAKVIVEYVDSNTGEVLEKVEISGADGDPYETKPKDFDGYELIEIIGDKKGTLDADEEKKITYIYKKPAELEIKYVDEENNKEIADKDIQKGYVGDEYTTTPKDLEFYELIKTPENYKGKLSNDTKVIYYYRKRVFDLSLNKTIDSMIIDGKVKDLDDSDIGKAEVHRKKVNTTNVIVVYNIRVKNVGEIRGKATILEKIPDYFKMYEKDNPGWTVTNGKATMKTEELEPGETKTYKVRMRWLKGNKNFGMATNIAKLESTENPAGYDEENLTDNTAQADVVVTVSTGVQKVSAVVFIAFTYLIAAIYVNRKLTFAVALSKVDERNKQ